MDLKDKVIMVTGAAQGIGEATARLCAARGATVILADLKHESGEAVAASIRESGGSARFDRLDVRDEAGLRAVMASVGETFGRLDSLVCAAGVLKGAYLQPEELSLEDFETVLDINLRGIFLCAKYGVPLLEAARRTPGGPAGVMVVIASVAGVSIPSSSLAYGASKGGVNGLGMTLAARLAPRGIRVNVVCPGNIATEMKLSVVAAEAERAGQPKEVAFAKAREEMGSPEGVARLIAFLVSEEADYVRGTLFTR